MSKPPLPSVGDVYAYPLQGGGFSACRVIDRKDQKPTIWLVVGTRCFTTEQPTGSEPAIRERLKLTMGANRNDLAFWTPKKLPGDFVLIGSVAPVDEEKQLASGVMADWLLLPNITARQFAHEGLCQRSVTVEKARRSPSEKCSPENFEDVLFSCEDDDPDYREGAGRIVTELKHIGEIGSRSTCNDIRESEFQRSIQRINEINNQYEVIDTLEREQLWELLVGFGKDLEVRSPDTLVDELRDW